MKIKQRKYSDHKARRKKKKVHKEKYTLRTICVTQYPFMASQKEGQKKGENK